MTPPMPSPSGLLVALLATLQLLLAPLAASAPCAWFGGGLDCCCAPATSSSQEESGGCCADEAPSEEPPSDPCACEAVPLQPPAEAPGLGLGSELACTDAVLQAPCVDAPASIPGISVARPRPPGSGPPPLLRFQVFRL